MVKPCGAGARPSIRLCHAGRCLLLLSHDPGRREFGNVQYARFVAIGLGEAIGGLDSPFVETELAVAIGVEFRTGFAAARQPFLARDRGVEILVVAAEALLLAVASVAAGGSAALLLG